MALDFIKIKKRNKGAEIFPDFSTSRRVKDLMVRGGAFYAIWDEERGLWSKDEYDVQRLIDKMLYEYNASRDNEYFVASMEDNSSGMWRAYKQYVKQLPDNYHELDRKIIFANTPCEKKDYASMRLPYDIVEQDTPAYEKLVSTLYDPEERDKFEWAIGAIISGDSKTIQKFIVFYGESGSGKSTVMNIVESLFPGYTASFEAKILGSSNNAFALEAFKSNPLIAIQQDGDLSKIEDNTKLNSIISHEKMSVNEKFKALYETSFDSFLIMGTNTPVRITDARSGMNRRLIDVHPSNRRVSYREYNKLVAAIEFELGGIAYHCLEKYKRMGKGYYNNYIPIDMISGTNHFYDFIVENSVFFKREKYVSLKTAWTSYKEYVDYARVPYPLTLQRFKEEMKAYFSEFIVNKTIEGEHLRNCYTGFRLEKIEGVNDIPKPDTNISTWLKFDTTGSSVFDMMASDYPAQYATESGTPRTNWRSCTSTLKELATSQLHYVKIPENHIIIDFDIKDPETGEKDLKRNIEAASKFPPTYAEVSKSGKGIHLHYIYDGDPSRLSRIYEEGVEIKVYKGDSALRRQLTSFVSLQIAHIASGLPLKEDKEVVSKKRIENEKHLRTLIFKCLRKEYGSTKCCVDLINKLVTESYESGIPYDITDLRPAIQAFAIGSTNNSQYCLRVVTKMHYKSEVEETNDGDAEDDIIFVDVEVFPNVFIVCYKKPGENQPVIKMINPSARDVEALFKYRIIGFNCRNYDNHILYAATIGYSGRDLYLLSKRIIDGSPNSKFGAAYNLSYTDVYDYAAKKQSLKKWEIELGCHHLENAYDWDKDLDPEHWEEVANYCANDVIATEVVFNHTADDFLARQILAKVTGGSVNDTTNSLTTKLVFAGNKNPRLVYTNLATGEQTDPDIRNPYSEGIEMAFPGYEYKDGKNLYRGEDIGRGGYIRSWPGMYENVALLDIASMHPTSAIVMNYFGEYTVRFKAIKDARVAIKHGDLKRAKEILSIFIPEKDLDIYLADKKTAKGLAQALKIAINSVYGLTAASFPNAFRDERNVNNIVALRGALFMRTLRDEIEARGYSIVAIKTDSIKIAEADEEIIAFCMDFARKYGYEFEHEATYARMCQVNDADYVALEDGKWTATGKMFQIPYVFKTLFTKDPIEFKDLCETKEVKTALYLDMGTEEEPDMHFIGRIGAFCPMMSGGGTLYRDKGDGGYAAATGSKGYKWLEAETVKNIDIADKIDMSYFRKLTDTAFDELAKYGDAEWFIAA